MVMRKLISRGCLCKAVSKTMRWSGTLKIARTLSALSVITACSAMSYQGLRLHQDGVPNARLPFQGPCPRPTDIQDPKIVNSFNISKLEGLWYEIAYKDLTQPRMCRCTTSYKKTLPDQRQLADSFAIQCPPESTTYAEALVFNLTDQPGVLLGSWTNLPRASQIVFPDMVVDVQEEDDGQRYQWVLEFQCIDNDQGVVMFIGINFYSRSNTTRDLSQMLTSARSHQLGSYLDAVRPYHLVNHTDCVYEPSMQGTGETSRMVTETS